jgi:O-antigen ligase/tetratricopeptide (TPR) repeat protein
MNMKSLSYGVKLLAAAAIFSSLALTLLGRWNIWGLSYTVRVIVLALAALNGGGYLLWRGVRQKAPLHLTGIEWVAIFGLAAFGASWLASDYRSVGIEYVVAILGYLLLFYLLMDAFNIGLPRKALLLGVLVFTGIVALQAAGEVYNVYSSWWEGVGSWRVQPPYPYRLTGLLGHANPYMGMMNLTAPFALVWFFKARSRFCRLGCGVWLALFAFTVPFSSSRGGMLALATWLGILFLLWAWDHKVWIRLLNLLKSRPLLVVVLALIAAAAGIYAASQVLGFFNAHPTHSSVLTSRTGFWSLATNIWQNSPYYPWLGAGPGRFVLEYQGLEGGYPDSFWAMHAHGLVFQTLAEFGLLGVTALLTLIGVGLRQLVRFYHHSRPELRHWNQAILAAVAGWLAHGLFEDFTWWRESIVLIILLAWITTSATISSRYRRAVPLNILWLPLVILISLQGWSLWAYQPAASVVADGCTNDLKTAALLAEQSALREPDLRFYSTQAGFVWAAAWGQSQDPAALVKARRYLENGLVEEANLSQLWASLAVLDWLAGEPDLGLVHMQNAMQLSPLSPSYPLNTAWFMERSGQDDQASAYYLQTLDIAPSWASHPFWGTSDLRRAALQEWKGTTSKTATGDDPGRSPYWIQARRAAENGDFDEALRLLAYSKWVRESNPARLVVQGQIAELEGRNSEALKIYEYMLKESIPPTLNLFLPFYKNYGDIYHREMITTIIIPGYLRLEENVGQFDAIQQLMELYQQNGQTEQARKVESWLQKNQNGGSIDSVELITICTKSE